MGTDPRSLCAPNLSRTTARHGIVARRISGMRGEVRCRLSAVDRSSRLAISMTRWLVSGRPNIVWWHLTSLRDRRRPHKYGWVRRIAWFPLRRGSSRAAKLSASAGDSWPQLSVSPTHEGGGRRAFGLKSFRSGACLTLGMLLSVSTFVNGRSLALP